MIKQNTGTPASLTGEECALLFKPTGLQSAKTSTELSGCYLSGDTAYVGTGSTPVTCGSNIRCIGKFGIIYA